MRLAVPRPGDAGIDPSMVGKAFVAFDTTVAAAKAVAALNNRKFGDNTVRATYIDDAAFPGQ